MGTIDGNGGTNTLTVSADLDLGAITLANIDKIQTDNALTMDNTQLHNQTINLSGAGSVIFSANTTSGNNNYANITSSLTAGLIMIVASGLTLAAGDNLGDIDKIELQSGTFTLDASKLDGKDIEIANGGAVVINNANGQNLENLKLSGAGSVTINVADGDSTLDASGIDVSTFTGTVTINDGSGSDTITGTAKVDVINSTAGTDSIQGGSGDDTITIDSLPSSINGEGGSDELIINGSMDLTGITINNIESITVNSGYVARLTKQVGKRLVVWVL